MTSFISLGLLFLSAEWSLPKRRTDPSFRIRGRVFGGRDGDPERPVLPAHPRVPAISTGPHGQREVLPEAEGHSRGGKAKSLEVARSAGSIILFTWKI